MLVVLGIGTVGFHSSIGEPWLQSFYRAVVSSTLTGLDTVPKNDGARIITGSEDNGHEPSLALQERIKDCERVTIHGAGHSCNMEQPWEWDAHFLRFMVKHGLFEE